MNCNYLCVISIKQVSKCLLIDRYIDNSRDIETAFIMKITFIEWKIFSHQVLFIIHTYDLYKNSHEILFFIYMRTIQFHKTVKNCANCNFKIKNLT